MSNFVEWSRHAGIASSTPQDPRPRRVGITTRVMPAAFKHQMLHIEDGEPCADINLDHAGIRFPEPFDEQGEPTFTCRQWIVEAVRQTIQRTGRKMWITWPDRSFTSFPGERLTPTHHDIIRSAA